MYTLYTLGGVYLAICLPTTLGGVHPTYMPPYCTTLGTPYTTPSTGVPGHDVHYAQCPGGGAWGSV